VAESEPLEAEPAEVEQAVAEMPDQLELVPPSEASELDSAYGFEESEDSGGAVVATQTLRENLARTEEELFNQKQQNEYLEQRIKELEAEVEAGQQGSVADTDLANMEERLRQEREAAARATADSEPWYSKFRYWLIALLVVAAGLIGWLVSRRSGAAAAIAEEEAISDIKEEAEELLRVLEDKDDSEEAVEQVVEADEPAAEEKTKATREFGETGGDAEILDEESSDPEIQLDLARAYISMGDKEAARVILEEVAVNGSEEQQAEAKSMMDQL
jgi:pilus assembly protein FimV